jgi:hypothetical protein
MAFVVLAIAVAAFVLCLRLTGIVERAVVATTRARRVAAVMRADDIGDDQKEAAAREAAVQMSVAFAVILLGFGIALAASIAVVLLAVAVGVTTLADAEAATLDWRFILGSTIALIAAWRLLR